MDSGSSEASSTPTLRNPNVYKYIALLDCLSGISFPFSLDTRVLCDWSGPNGLQYKKNHLHVLPDLCADLILGQGFQTQHQSITLNYDGKWQPLDLVCGLRSLNVKPPDLFANLTADCHPVACRSHRYSFADKQFIENETKRL